MARKRPLGYQDPESKAKFVQIDVSTLPISEQYVCRTPKLTPKQCIAILRRMAKAEPERVITRNYFRIHSGIPERTWRHHFGSFEEFKRQAKVIITRHVRRQELFTSKHASVDHYRALGREAAGWGEKYTRPSGKRFQTILVASDFHDKNVDPFALRVFLDTARRAQPETVVLAGDVFDSAEFGRHTVDLRSWDPDGRVRAVQERIIRPLRDAVPNSQIDLVAGNHDLWVVRLLADQTPAMQSLLFNYHNWTLADLYDLRRSEVNFVSRCDLSAWTRRDEDQELKRNFKLYNGCFLVHHFPKEGLRKQTPGVAGHMHRFQAWSFESPHFGSYSFVQLGAMHARSAAYTDAERWSQGFALAHLDTKALRVQIEYVPIGETSAVVGGRWYFRERGEFLTA